MLSDIFNLHTCTCLEELTAMITSLSHYARSRCGKFSNGQVKFLSILIGAAFNLFSFVVLISGEWMLFDKCTGLGLVNRFNVSEVHKCLVHWGTGTVNLELWSEDRPVSKESPLRISHEYEVTSIA